MKGLKNKRLKFKFGFDIELISQRLLSQILITPKNPIIQVEEIKKWSD